MATGELNPNHYPAQRAAKVVQHYLNARYGSPYRLFGLQRVHSGNAQVCCVVSFSFKEARKLMTISSWLSFFQGCGRLWEKIPARALGARTDQQRKTRPLLKSLGVFHLS